jgi:hypothetical protein
MPTYRVSEVCETGTSGSGEWGLCPEVVAELILAVAAGQIDGDDSVEVADRCWLVGECAPGVREHVAILSTGRGAYWTNGAVRWGDVAYRNGDPDALRLDDGGEVLL